MPLSQANDGVPLKTTAPYICVAQLVGREEFCVIAVDAKENQGCLWWDPVISVGGLVIRTDLDFRCLWHNPGVAWEALKEFCKQTDDNEWFDFKYMGTLSTSETTIQ
jgi:hypothetical protein